MRICSQENASNFLYPLFCCKLHTGIKSKVISYIGMQSRNDPLFDTMQFPNCSMPSIMFQHLETANIDFFLASDPRNAADPAFFESQSLNVNGSDCPQALNETLPLYIHSFKHFCTRLGILEFMHVLNYDDDTGRVTGDASSTYVQRAVSRQRRNANSLVHTCKMILK